MNADASLGNRHRPFDRTVFARVPLLHAISSVAGIHVPAFVERWTTASSATRRRRSRVSPGFTSRPSLSVVDLAPDFRSRPRVAGIHVPAFVERRRCRGSWGRRTAVSPGFTSRPSLSDVRAGCHRAGWRVSPGFTSRPSLSEVGPEVHADHVSGVAGIHVPAFVERGSSASDASASRRVAGIHVPAFVERGCRLVCGWGRRAVSPGFTSRPSLSGRHSPASRRA